MRLIDADALSAFVGDLRSTLHKEQSTFKAMTEIEFNTRDYMLLNFQQTIDNAPTIDDLSEYSDKLWKKAYERGKAEARPQGKWIGGEIGLCSICGSKGCASDIWNGCKDGMYCPNCGADMRVKGGRE